MNISTLTFVLLLTAAIGAYAQDLEKRVASDLRELGYELEKPADGNGYYVSKPHSIYDDSKDYFYVATLGRDRAEMVLILTWIEEIPANDTLMLGQRSQHYLKRNTAVPCARYGLLQSDNATWSVRLSRLVEVSCYSKDLIGSVIDCIQREKEKANRRSGFAGMKDDKGVFDSGPEEYSKIKPKR